jgi:hypothetical protein
MIGDRTARGADGRESVRLQCIRCGSQGFATVLVTVSEEDWASQEDQERHRYREHHKDEIQQARRGPHGTLVVVLIQALLPVAPALIPQSDAIQAARHACHDDYKRKHVEQRHLWLLWAEVIPVSPPRENISQKANKSI